jgi:hypothetical protein
MLLEIGDDNKFRLVSVNSISVRVLEREHEVCGLCKKTLYLY